MTTWYAVQVGGNYDWDFGSHDYGEALEMARKEHIENPDDEIRIAHIDEENNFCDDEEIVY